MKQWFVAESVRNKEVAASLSVAEFGFQAYVPLDPRVRQRGKTVIRTQSPRFGVYIFVRFDRDNDPWPELIRGHASKHKYFKRVLCSVGGVPVPVPDPAMEAIRAFRPEPQVQQRTVYQPGQRVVCIMGGTRREAVFVEYCGSRPMIRMWIFGADRVTEVSTAELEPLDLDTQISLAR